MKVKHIGNKVFVMVLTCEDLFVSKRYSYWHNIVVRNALPGIFASQK